MSKIILYTLLPLFYISCSTRVANGNDSKAVDSVGMTANPDSITKPVDTAFCFVCRGIDRKENFDSCPVEVTIDNVAELYRLYQVEPLDNCDLYIVNPYKLYTTSEYFTRLIRFEGGKQVAAITFYGWNAPYVFPQDDKYMVGLNSLATTAGLNTSTFTCKSILLDKSLKIINEREFRYKEQRDPHYAYVYFDTIIQKKDGYDFRIINTGFDASDYFEYKGHLSKDNIVTESSKKNIKVDQ